MDFKLLSRLLRTPMAELAITDPDVVTDEHFCRIKFSIDFPDHKDYVADQWDGVYRMAFADRIMELEPGTRFIIKGTSPHGTINLVKDGNRTLAKCDFWGNKTTSTTEHSEDPHGLYLSENVVEGLYYDGCCYTPTWTFIV